MSLLILSFNWMSDESFGMSDCYKDYCLNSYTSELLNRLRIKAYYQSIRLHSYTPELLHSYKKQLVNSSTKFKLCG